MFHSADVFIDPGDQLIGDHRFHRSAATHAKALRALATGSDTDGVLGRELPPAVWTRPPYDPSVPYREPKDALKALQLLREYRDRVTVFLNHAEWEEWEPGTRKQLAAVLRQLRGMEAMWIADAVQIGWSMQHAGQLFRTMTDLADDLQCLPRQCPGIKSLGERRDELSRRYDSIEPEMRQLCRLFSARAPVVLRGRSKQPLVLGRPVPRLGASEYRIIEALVKACDAGLRKDEIDAIANVNSGVTTIRRLCKKYPDSWGKVISMPGRRRGGYRIVTA